MPDEFLRSMRSSKVSKGNAVQMEFVYTENVCVDRITADNRAVNYQQWAMGQKQACFCHKTTTTA